MNAPNLSLFQEYCAATEAMVEAVQRCWEQVKAQPIVAGAIENAAQLLITQRDYYAVINAMAEVREYLRQTGQEDCVVYALFQALVLPDSLTLLRSMGIPEDCILDNFRDFANWERNYALYHDGAVGFDEFGWMLIHFTGHLVKLGRLQYIPSVFAFPYHVYRSRATGDVVALARSGLAFTADGHRQGASGYPDPAAFTATLTFDGDAVTGYPVDLARGVVCSAPVTLDTRDYELILIPGSPVIDVHIPEAEPFTPELIDDSLARAKAFYAGRGVDVRAFACHSWLLDSELSTITAPGSNVRAFMERWSKLPVPDAQMQILERVMAFDFTMDKLESFECRTGLQRRLKERLLSGGRFYTTAGFILL